MNLRDIEVMQMSKVHPFDGEKLSYGEMLQFWEKYSPYYSGLQQGDIPDRIVDYLFEEGVFQEEDHILEIGSGPGTYSLKIAPRVKTITCIDSSESMLKRLTDGASSNGLDNVRCIKADWDEYKSDRIYDSCIATLCPGSGAPESIHRMESSAERACALVSWVTNHGDELDALIWKELGKDYGYGFRKSTAVQDWLSDNNREPVVKHFKTVVEADWKLSDIVAKTESSFRACNVNVKLEHIIKKILGPELDGDVFHYTAENEMKLIYWVLHD